MKLRIALIGDVPADNKAESKVNNIIGQLTAYFCKNIESFETEITVSTSYSGKRWSQWLDAHDFSVCSVNLKGAEPFCKAEKRSLQIDAYNRTYIGDHICNMVDVSIAIWNEDISDFNGATWEFLNMAYKKSLPCVWISSVTNNVYTIGDSYYNPFTPSCLEKKALPLSSSEGEAAEVKDNPEVTFWNNLRKKYLKKYKADNSVFTSEDDAMLGDSFDCEAENGLNKDVYRNLLTLFKKFDKQAIRFSERFLALLYARSIIPIITTVFIAIGFYAESLVGRIWKWQIPDMAVFAARFTGIVAGVGFFIHGLLNLYVYRLSVSKKTESWKNQFLNSRFKAELYRLLLHIAPYNLNMDLRKICAGNYDTLNTVLHINDDFDFQESYEINSETVAAVKKHINGMLDDQIAYHKKSVMRYEKIVNKLAKWGKIIAYLAFALVIVRSLLQFALSIYHLPALNGLDVNAWTSSFANFIALFFPAWAGYFTSKVSLNNFSFNLSNHKNMLSRLERFKEKINVPANSLDKIEVLDATLNELAEVVMIQDTAAWKNQYSSTAIKPL